MILKNQIWPWYNHENALKVRVKVISNYGPINVKQLLSETFFTKSYFGIVWRRRQIFNLIFASPWNVKTSCVIQDLTTKFSALPSPDSKMMDLNFGVQRRSHHNKGHLEASNVYKNHFLHNHVFDILELCMGGLTHLVYTYTLFY